MKISSIFLVAAAVLLTLAGTARAQYSLAGNWNSSSDLTSNVWAYGVFTSLLNPGTFTVGVASNNGSGTLNAWQLTSGTDPNIEKNLTSSPIFGSAVDWLPGTVSFGPYQGPAVAQFTAPAAGVYNISATFQTDQIRGSEESDGTTGYVYVGGTNEFTQELLDPGASQFGTAATFDENFTLSVGEKVDFVVGNGAFTTRVDATLTELPEPSTYAMLIGGLAVLGICVRRKLAWL